MAAILGIDFGTTYSSAAFKVSSDTEIRKVKNYPGSCDRRRRAERGTEVPTALWYSKNEDGQYSYTEWGFGARNRRTDNNGEGVYIDSFKLMLFDSWDESFRATVGNTMELIERTVADVIIDYLSKLLEFAVGQLREIHTLKQPKGPDRQSECSEIVLVLTVPVIWNISARAAMHDAAEIAAKRIRLRLSDRIRLYSEPEAVATYAFQHYPDLIPQKEEMMMIVDAGGGTTDVVGYTIKCENPLRLEETIRSTGRACGGSFVDYNMGEYLKEQYSAHKSIITHWARMSFDEIISIAISDFEKDLKRGFGSTGYDKSIHEFSFPGLRPGQKSKSGRSATFDRCRITGPELAVIFDTQVNPILQLLREQLQQVKSDISVTVLAAGGFSDSDYFRRHLGSELERLGHRFRDVALESNYAAAEGAVLRFLNREEGPKQLCRSNYAFSQEEDFDPKEHDEKYKEHDHNHNKDYVLCPYFFYEKGDTIDPGEHPKTIPMPLTWITKNLNNDITGRLTLYEVDGDKVDGKMKKHIALNDPDHRKNFERVGEIEFTLTSAQLRSMKLTRQHERHRYYYRIEYTPVVYVEGQEMWFELHVGKKRVAVGSLNDKKFKTSYDLPSPSQNTELAEEPPRNLVDHGIDGIDEELQHITLEPMREDLVSAQPNESNDSVQYEALQRVTRSRQAKV